MMILQKTTSNKEKSIVDSKIATKFEKSYIRGKATQIQIFMNFLNLVLNDEFNDPRNIYLKGAYSEVFEVENF